MTCTILERLAKVGLSVAVIEGNRLVVSPKALLNDELRTLIRQQRANIVLALQPEPPPDSADWIELDHAYHAHHFKCPTCIAAARGLGYGQRCGVGMALWRGYQDAVE